MCTSFAESELMQLCDQAQCRASSGFGHSFIHSAYLRRWLRWALGVVLDSTALAHVHLRAVHDHRLLNAHLQNIIAPAIFSLFGPTD